MEWWADPSGDIIKRNSAYMTPPLIGGVFLLESGILFTCEVAAVNTMNTINKIVLKHNKLKTLTDEAFSDTI